MRILMYFAGMFVGTIVGAVSVLIAGFFIDSNNRDD